MNNVTSASDSKTDIIRYSIYVFEGALMFVSNLLIFLCIIYHRALRHSKSHLLIAALSLSDALCGLGTLLAGPYRLWLISTGQQNRLVSRKYCFLTVFNVVWVFCFPLQGFMLLILSVDRFLAVCIPFRHFNYGRRYALFMTVAPYALCFISLLLGGATVWPMDAPEVKAICLTGWALPKPHYQAIYTFQVTATLLSIALYLPVILLYRKKVTNNAQEPVEIVNELNDQKRLTKSLGYSAFFTLVFFALPNSIIWLSHLLEYRFETVVVYAFIINNLNPLLNFCIFVKRHVEIRKGISGMVKFKLLPPDLSLWTYKKPTIRHIIVRPNCIGPS